MHAPLVRVEVHLASGLPAMTLVGLPEKAVKESKDRVRAAILNSGFEFPAKHITSTSPGLGMEPPPTSAVAELLWCGAR